MLKIINRISFSALSIYHMLKVDKKINKETINVINFSYVYENVSRDLITW